MRHGRLLSLLHEFVDVDYLEDIKRLSIVSFLRNAEHVFSQISLFKSLFLSKHPFDYYDNLFELVKEQGINDQMIRFSSGIEFIDDLKSDLSQAIKNCL